MAMAEKLVPQAAQDAYIDRKKTRSIAGVLEAKPALGLAIGMVTPPIGLNLFVTSGITGMSLAQVVKAALPFVVVLLIFLVIVTYVPVLSTLVPYALMGPEIILSR